ncbi:MAG: bifunctional molybdenum cofactor biosynthesis protein MoaC/MoaB [Calditrichae bacterium]|nr:bifunctional molybdenum cofactor biosynthesis protein MoaC/MoaB [Calditrichota bacterium]MCB9059435.1 bifunctional molybdenum cofactor biosynthesis protein MoaC/MoaB [Calditrichia bacterium]
MIDAKEIIKENGLYHMHDASAKPAAHNTSGAEGKIIVNDAARASILDNDKLKNDVVTAARVAGIQAAKRAAEFIPFHHSNTLTWVDLEFKSESDHIQISSVVKAVTPSSVDMEALTAVSVAALTILDMCREQDPEAYIKDIKLVPKTNAKKMLAVRKPQKVGILVISDRIMAGLAEDKVGLSLKDGFTKAGYNTDNYDIISNDADKLIEKVQKWLENDVELIFTLGGNGIGPRDITLTSLEPFFDFRIEGIEQTLHSIAQMNNSGFYVERLAAGKIGKTLLICLPLDQSLAQNAMNVLLPNIHQVFEF